MERRITRRQVARLRLQALGLVREGTVAATPSPVEVVCHHLAMQAQDWGASRWAIGSRSDAMVDADVIAAYDAGEIVRSWPMRGTVHVVAAEDLPWMLELMGGRALAGVQRRWDLLGIDEPTLERAREVAVALLGGGRRASRAELLAAFAGAGLDLGGQRSYHAVWYLAQTGTLVSGPTRGGEQDLVLLDEWIPTPRVLGRDEALRELGVRYLGARGPATVEDLVHWTKLTKRDCRAAFDSSGADIVELQRDGEAMFMLRERWEQHDPDLRRADQAVLALAPFDEHLLGYRRRADVLDAAHAERIVPGRNGVFRATIVAGSCVVATWKKTRREHHVALTVEPLGGAIRERPLAAALERYGRFIGSDITVDIQAAVVDAR